MSLTPHDTDAEAALLGAMMLSQDAIATAAEHLIAEDFYRPSHSHIFEAVIDLHRRGEPADPVTVADALTRAGLIEAIGGPATLTDLQAAAPSSRNAGRYAAIVAEMALLRRLAAVGWEITELAQGTPPDAEGALDRAEALVFALGDAGRERQTVHLGESMVGWLDALERRMETGEVTGVPTGWGDLDAMLQGLQPGQLVVIAGRPGMGKSTVGAELARQVAGAGHPTLFVSAEMSLHELQGRFMASAARVPLQSIRSARIAARDWARMGDGLRTMAEWPVHVEDDSGATVMSIRAAARRVAARHGRIGLVIVDYMQLLTATTKRDNREREVAELSSGLKKMARQMEVPVVALAQLNRGVELRADKRPTLADLRESGAIENDADVVLMLYRDDYYHPQSQDRGVLEVIVAKQRNGPTGTVRLAYDIERGRIMTMARM